MLLLMGIEAAITLWGIVRLNEHSEHGHKMNTGMVTHHQSSIICEPLIPLIAHMDTIGHV